MSTPSFDASALTDPVTRAQIREWKRTRRSGRRGISLTTIVNVLFGVVIVAVILGVLLPAVVRGAIGLIAQDPSVSAGELIFPVLILIAVVVGAGLILIGSWAAETRVYRLSRFARANGLTYVPTIDAPALPGMIFGLGRDRITRDAMRGTRPRFVEFGNYRYTTGNGKTKRTVRWGYVAIRLDSPLPHIVLDATGNNGLLGTTNLPRTLGRDQRLGLEGDFDKHFTLYCPEGYERDALYLFTPDVMARFIDRAAALDVEIVDDWLFLYSRRELSTTDPRTWAWLFGTVQAILVKLSQWGRWRDERLSAAAPSGMPDVDDAALVRPPAGVAPAGRRLRGGFPWITAGIAVAIIVVWVLTTSGVFSGVGI